MANKTGFGLATLPLRWRVAAALGIVYVIWGSTYLAIRFAIETIPPFLMASARFLVAGIILYMWTRWRGAERPTLAQWGSAAIVGALLLVFGNGGVVWAEQLVPSGVAALLVGTVPLWMVLLDGVRPGGVRPSLAGVVGLLVGFAGVVILIGPANLAGGGRLNPLGTAIVLIAAVSWAAGSLYSRSGRLPSSASMGSAAEMLAGGTLLLVAGMATGELGGLHLNAISVRSALGLVFLVVFGSLVAFSAYIWLLRTTAPSLVSTYAYVNPVVAVLLGWAFAGEPVTLRTILAAAVIVLGVVIITTFQARDHRHAAAGATRASEVAPASGEDMSHEPDEIVQPSGQHA